QGAHWPGAPMFVTFMVRRCFRVYPLSLIVVACMFLLRLPVAQLAPHTFTGIQPTAKVVLANLLLVQDLANTPSMPAALWSLPFEMRMYLFLPLLFVLARKYGAVWVLVTAATVTALAAIKPWGLLMFAPCFLPGVVGYSLWGRGKRLSWYLWPPTLGL